MTQVLRTHPLWLSDLSNFVPSIFTRLEQTFNHDEAIIACLKSQSAQQQGYLVLTSDDRLIANFLKPDVLWIGHLAELKGVEQIGTLSPDTPDLPAWIQLTCNGIQPGFHLSVKDQETHRDFLSQLRSRTFVPWLSKAKATRKNSSIEMLLALILIGLGSLFLWPVFVLRRLGRPKKNLKKSDSRAQIHSPEPAKFLSKIKT